MLRNNVVILHFNPSVDPSSDPILRGTFNTCREGIMFELSVRAQCAEVGKITESSFANKTVNEYLCSGKRTCGCFYILPRVACIGCFPFYFIFFSFGAPFIGDTFLVIWSFFYRSNDSNNFKERMDQMWSFIIRYFMFQHLIWRLPLIFQVPLHSQVMSLFEKLPDTMKRIFNKLCDEESAMRKQDNKKQIRGYKSR